MLDKCSVYNVLAEGMYLLGKCIFWTKVVHQISTFWTFHCLSEVAQIAQVGTTGLACFLKHSVY